VVLALAVLDTTDVPSIELGRFAEKAWRLGRALIHRVAQ
jgi:hypothetical protein